VYRSGFEGVANAADSAEEAVESGVAEFGSDIGEVHVNDVASGIDFCLPEGPEKVCSREDPARLAHEELEHLEFLLGEPEFLAVVGDEFSGRVEFEVSECEDIEAEDAELDGDAGEEFSEVEGFDEVVVGAEVEEFDFFFGGVAGGENNDRSVGVGSQAGKDVSAIAVGKAKIEENEVGGVFLGAGEALYDAGGVGGVIASVEKVY
jgi:hypothetical protein